MFQSSSEGSAISAEMPFIGEELENKKTCRGERPGRCCGTKRTVSFQPESGAEGRGRSEGINSRKEKQRFTVKKSLKYLLGSLAPSQPHHCLLTAFVSITDSPAHLEI